MPEPAATHPSSAGPGPRWLVRRFASIDSTNQYLLDEARAGAPAHTVAVADHQRRGRGRLGRTWEAAPGSALLASVLLRPEGACDLGGTTMAAGLALADAVRQVAGVETTLKWPNDLLVGDRKVAGILAEAEVEGAAVRALVVGVGCNLAPTAVPPGLEATATALELEAGCRVERDALLGAFLAALARWLGESPAAIRDAYATRSATLGRRVRVELGLGGPGGEVVEGQAVAVDERGALVVRRDDGTAVTVVAGDVVHLRVAS